MFDFQRITPFCLEKRLSRQIVTIVSKYLGGHGPFDSPGYAYAKPFSQAVVLGSTQKDVKK